MFGLFKPSTKKSVDHCLTLAEKAEIFAVMEDGYYSTFLITLPTIANESIKYFQNHDSLAAFRDAINERIFDGQFTDPGAFFASAREESGWEPNLNVKRMVVDKENELMLHWQP